MKYISSLWDSVKEHKDVVELAVLIISIIALIATLSGNITAVQALNTSITQYNEDVIAEANAERQLRIYEINSLIIEFEKNIELIDDYQLKQEDYFVEEDGEFISGNLTVQYQLSVDNITEVLAKANISDDGLVRQLWNIKFYSTQINNKIYDARMSLFDITRSRARKMQKEIFDRFDKLEPLLEEAITDLKAYKATLRSESNS